MAYAIQSPSGKYYRCSLDFQNGLEIEFTVDYRKAVKWTNKEDAKKAMQQLDLYGCDIVEI